jgi:hypothetical protein
MRITALSLLLVLAAPAIAAEVQPAGRYVFIPVEAGTLRLDTTTGAVSLCAGAASDLSCTIVPDEAREADAYDAALRDRVTALEARVVELEERSLTGELLPDEESIDRVMVLADRMMRHFFGIVRDMKREMEGEEL